MPGKNNNSSRLIAEFAFEVNAVGHIAVPGTRSIFQYSSLSEGEGGSRIC